MIEAYTGTPGSGKSYHAVYDMVERIKWGHPVITNIPLNLGKIKEKRASCYVFKETFEMQDENFILWLKEFSSELCEEKKLSRLPEDYIFLVIDEAQLIFNCRDWQDKNRKLWTSFFQLHRKYGYHVILITQMSKMLDKHIQGLLEYEIIHRKFSNFGLKGIFLSFLLLSPNLFACVRMWAAMRTRIDCKIIRYSNRIGKYYNTNTDFSIEKKEIKN